LPEFFNLFKELVSDVQKKPGPLNVDTNDNSTHIEHDITSIHDDSVFEQLYFDITEN